jgi:hypothetical protein
MSAQRVGQLALGLGVFSYLWAKHVKHEKAHFTFRLSIGRFLVVFPKLFADGG